MSKELLSNPALKVSGKEQAGGLEVQFSGDYTSKEYQLFEVPDGCEELLEKIMAGVEQPKIQGFVSRTGKHVAPAAIITSSETFKVKKAESTNNMYILSVPSAEATAGSLQTVTSEQIELSRQKLNVTQILDFLSDCVYSAQAGGLTDQVMAVDDQRDLAEPKTQPSAQTRSKQEILDNCQVSTK